MQSQKKINKLSRKVTILKSKIGSKVESRLKEFKENKNWFSELCFCILTANYTAEGGIRIQNSIADFSVLSVDEIESNLRKHGYRFPKVRAEYITLAKKHKSHLFSLKSLKNSNERREWLVQNVKGIGYKEASHFLRNIGFFDVAIIDRHILSILQEYDIIKKPKSISKKQYLEIENLLQKIAEQSSTSLGELDLYLWYMKTGKILK